MRGRRITLVAGLAVVVVGLLIALDWNRFVESWYLWRLKSDDVEVRDRALHGLAEVGTVRAVPALIEVIRMDIRETAYVKPQPFCHDPTYRWISDSDEYEVWLEGSVQRDGVARKCEVRGTVQFQDIHAPAVLLTPAAFTLYRIGEAALSAVSTAEPGEGGRLSWTFYTITDAIRRDCYQGRNWTADGAVQRIEREKEFGGYAFEEILEST